MAILKLDKISTFIFGLITSVGVIVTLFLTLAKPAPDLSAYVSKHIFYLPPQYTELTTATRAAAGWESVYNLINAIAPDTDFSAKEKTVDQLQQMILKPFSAPFKHGLDEYKTLTYIAVTNSGDALAKDIYVDFPQSALLMIEDDKKDMSSVAEPVKRYSIPSLRQNGTWRIWAWNKPDAADFNEYDIRVGSENEVVNVEYAQSYYGLQAIVADNYKLVLFLVGLMVLFYIYILVQLIKSLRQS